VILLITFPIFIYRIIFKTPESELIEDEEKAAKIGSLYEGTKLNFGKRGAYYNVVFTLRRFSYASLLVFLPSFNWVQILLFFVLQIAIILYVGVRRPKDTRFNNRLELFNEFWTLVISYHLLIFTDYYTDV